MFFIESEWDLFCKKLYQNNIISISSKEVIYSNKNRFLILKHDVETNPQRALALAKIESKYGHRGSYYFQAYILKNKRYHNIIQEIIKLGHEVSYHHDVMDFSKGNIEKALEEFQKNKLLFEGLGINIVTVCQHGNPIVNRNGYNSNRDFFRNNKIRKIYNNIYDIMVNYKDKINNNYQYISDAGRKFNIIFDPINNDIYKSDDKNIEILSFDLLLSIIISKDDNYIISIHPHRWYKNKIYSLLNIYKFFIIKGIAKLLCKSKIIKIIIGKFYFLAKKI